MNDDILFENIPEIPGAGRLGRHIQHDPRSLAYEFQTAGITVAPVRHTRNVPVFDQGDLGSCTGNAAVGCISTDPLYGQLPAGHPTLNEALAVKTYGIATTLDGDPGTYPPTDTGSTGLGAAKALQQQGFIVGFQHTFSFTDFLKATSLYPTMMGINWYTTFDSPDADGLVKIGRGATVRGGHEIYADEITTDNKIGFTNSWSTSFGVDGRFYMDFATVERLLAEKGDVTVPIPASTPVVNPTPAPTPTPAPSQAPEDVALYAAVQTWAKTKGLAA